MTLQEFRDLLLTVMPNVHHYDAGKQTGNYIVWSEYGENALCADNKVSVSAQKVQVDYYTKTEFDPLVDQLRAALNEAEIPYSYDCDTERDGDGTLLFIRHIFDCEVP